MRRRMRIKMRTTRWNKVGERDEGEGDLKKKGEEKWERNESEDNVEKEKDNEQRK